MDHRVRRIYIYMLIYEARVRYNYMRSNMCVIGFRYINSTDEIMLTPDVQARNKE